jgi:hypothetical protein
MMCVVQSAVSTGDCGGDTVGLEPFALVFCCSCGRPASRERILDCGVRPSRCPPLARRSSLLKSWFPRVDTYRFDDGGGVVARRGQSMMRWLRLEVAVAAPLAEAGLLTSLYFTKPYMHSPPPARRTLVVEV